MTRPVTLTDAILGHRPYILIETHETGGELRLGGTANVTEDRALLREATRAVRLARRAVRIRARQERKAARLQSNRLRDFDIADVAAEALDG